MLNGVLEPRFRWQFPDLIAVPEDVTEAGRRAGFSDRVLELLVRRGIRTRAEIDAFAAPALQGLHDPALLPDADRLLARLQQARNRHERVMVFGDFDADGLSGLAILVLALRDAGIEVVPYVPSRIEEGHGISLRAVDEAVERGCGVILTVDCGTTSVDETRVAVQRGIDVLITDHHHVPAVVPSAFALVNPHRPESPYPDRGLTGSGVAFKVASLVVPAMGSGDLDPMSLADLATIGTVADMAPIQGENRAIAILGLEAMRARPRPGIAALLARAGVPPSGADLETVGFSIAPRLNAAGRVGDAAVAARLLLSTTMDEAEVHATALELANTTRRDVTALALADARATVEGQGPAELAAIVVLGDWSPGVVGLVAGKLAEEYGRPAVVATHVGDVLRASCRSAAGFNLAIALEECGDMFVRFGGHPGAAGFELAAVRWEEFRSRFSAIAAAAPARDPRPALAVDIALHASAVDYPLLREIARLAPFGPGNADPLLAIVGLTVVRVRTATGGHTQLTLRRVRDVLDAIAFGRDDLSGTLAEGDRIDVVARLASRRFGGYETLQLEVRDVSSSGHYPEAATILADTATAPAPRVVAGLVPAEAG